MLQRSLRVIPLALLVAAWAQNADQPFDSQALLRRALALVQRNIDRAPRYTCRQTIYRSQYVPAHALQNCGELLHASTKDDFRLAAEDRIRLDVSVTRDGEIFSWAGEKTFQSERVSDIVGGGLSASGDFDTFLGSIFDSDTVLYQYLGVVESGGRNYAEYAYSIPRVTSRYEVQIGRNSKDEKTVPYLGRFQIDVQTAELTALTIKMDPPPEEIEACGVETHIQYRRLTIGASSFLLPERTLLVENLMSGRRSENTVQYDGCREFQSQSVFLPSVEETPAAAGAAPVSAAPPKLPEGLKLQIRLRTPIDSTTAFAGDPLQGELVKSISLPDAPNVLPKGTKVYGRLVTFRQDFLRQPFFVIGIRWDSIETPAGRAPLTLTQISDSKYISLVDTRPGVGAYIFRSAALRLDDTFVAMWRVEDIYQAP